MPKLNFAGVPDQKSFDPAPAGEYELELTDYKEDEVRSGDNAGATMYKLTWEIKDDANDKVDGKKVFDNQTYTEKAMFRVKAMLKAFGYEVPDDDGADDVDFEYDDLLGQKLRARLSVQPESKDKVSGRMYAAKNQIAKYIIPGDE